MSVCPLWDVLHSRRNSPNWSPAPEPLVLKHASREGSACAHTSGYFCILFLFRIRLTRPSIAMKILSSKLKDLRRCLGMESTLFHFFLDLVPVPVLFPFLCPVPTQFIESTFSVSEEYRPLLHGSDRPPFWLASLFFFTPPLILLLCLRLLTLTSSFFLAWSCRVSRTSTAILLLHENGAYSVFPSLFPNFFYAFTLCDEL